MLPIIAIWLALLTPQATTPAAPPPPSDSTAPQSAPAKPCGLDASGKYHAGCGVTPPKVIHAAEPEFSEAARKKKLNATATVSLTVDEQGNTTDVHIIHSAADDVAKKDRKAALTLDEKALEAVRKYKFSPGTYQGRPVPVELKVEVNFQIF
ncbi:MAG TPA: energy transducer TonB [Acidobacteriaceae bacterium]